MQEGLTSATLSITAATRTRWPLVSAVRGSRLMKGGQLAVRLVALAARWFLVRKKE